MSSTLIKTKLWSGLNLLNSADCRSWLSLPNEIQIAQFNISVGTKCLTFQEGTDVWLQSLTLNIVKNSRTFILVRSMQCFRKINVTVFNMK